MNINLEYKLIKIKLKRNFVKIKSNLENDLFLGAFDFDETTICFYMLKYSVTKDIQAVIDDSPDWWIAYKSKQINIFLKTI